MKKTESSIRSMTSEPKRFICPSGSRMENIYEYKVMKNGEKKLIKTGEKDTYAEIQSHAESVNIETIMKHLAVGDKSDFRPDGIYADMTKMPKNMIDAMNAMNELNNTWNKLPANIKAKYDHNVELFMAQAGSEAWMLDMGLLNPTQKETVKATDTVPEVKVEIPETKTE